MWKPELDRRHASEAERQAFSTYFDLLLSDKQPAIRSVDAGAVLTFEALKQFVSSFDLGCLGVGQGERLCSVLPNGPEAAVAFLTFSCYCTYAPLNPALVCDELSFEFEDLPAKAVVVMQGSDAATAIKLAAEMHVAVLEMAPLPRGGVGPFSLKVHPASLTPLPVQRRFGERHDVCLVLHTSGTTTKPKIVPLSHTNIAVGSLCIASALKLKRASVNLNVMPLYHIHGISINLLASLLSGASCIAGPTFNPASFVGEWLRGSPRPTWYSSVPTIHQLILQYSQLPETPPPLHALEFIRSESSILPLSVGEGIEALFGCKVSQTYAMTESMPIAANPLGDARKLSSVGPSAGPDIRICSDEGEPMMQGEEGEVCVRGACVTRGYELRDHMKQDPNIDAFHSSKDLKGRQSERWLRTGDKGSIDADGYLSLSGRFKEIINRGGDKISPFVVEHALRRHPSVSDLLVFAAPHALLGEVVGVAVVPKMPCSLSLAEMRRFAQDQGIAPMWLPEALVFIDAVPKGATGKPARIGLAKRLNVEEIGGPPAKGESVALSIGNSAVYHDSISLSANQERKAGSGVPGAAWMEHAKFLAIIYVVYEHSFLYIDFSMFGLAPDAFQSSGSGGMGHYSAMVTFMFCAGATSTAELSAAAVKRQFVGLLVPALLTACYVNVLVVPWQAPLQGTTVGMSLLRVAGFVNAGFQADILPWFLPALFLLRVAVLPVLASMHTILLVIFTLLGSLCFALTHHGFENDHSDDGFEAALIYLPWFMAGFLANRFRLFEAYIGWAKRNPQWWIAVRALSFACFIGGWSLEIFERQTISTLANVGPIGCTKHGTTAGNPGTNVIEEVLDATFSPIALHLADLTSLNVASLGCIIANNGFRLLYLFAHWFWLPLGFTTFWTDAGTRTLGLYLFAGTVVYLVTLLVIAANKVVPTSTWPPYVGQPLILVSCTLSSALFCTGWFQWSLTPLISPGWLLRILDGKLSTDLVVPAPPARVPAQYGLLFWLLVFLTQAGFLHVLTRYYSNYATLPGV